MKIFGTCNLRNENMYNVVVKESLIIENMLNDIISSITSCLDSKALDWQERDRLDRAIKNIKMTQLVLAARIARHTKTQQVA